MVTDAGGKRRGAAGLLGLFGGKWPKWRLLALEVFNVTFMLSFWALAQHFFPGRYTPLENHISDQGGLAANPTGHWFFNASVVVTGVLVLPAFAFLYHRLAVTCSWTSRLFLVSTVVGSAAFSGLGVFPQDVEVPHDWCADLAFGGLGFGAFLMMLVVLRSKLPPRAGGPWPNWLVLPYGFLVVAAALAATVPNAPPGVRSAWTGDPRVFDDPPWQWTSFFAVLAWLICSLLAAPGEKQTREDRRT
ncbi:MAG: hypothetical protein Kow0069_35460 [Promethearchaeota archaeon]